MRKHLALLSLLIFLSACSLLPANPFAADTPAPTTQAAETTPPTATATTRPLATVEPSRAATAIATAAPTAAPSPPAAIAPENARQAAAEELESVVPPFRDDVALAIAYLGADPVLATPAPPEELQTGEVASLYIGNVDSNTVSQIDAELLSAGRYAYFWFDLGDGSVQPDAAELAAVTTQFDAIYETLHEFFGVSPLPGGRAHIVHASPNALCDDPNRCFLAGYYSSRDSLPAGIFARSNERPMFVMNTQQWGQNSYLDVLAHELRHMLGSGFEAGEEDWFVEGGAMLAEDLAGYPADGQARGTLFLQNTDQQLNSWTDGNAIPHYGQGYLLSRFLYDRLGEERYREFLFNPAPGLAAVDALQDAPALGLSGVGIWLDWLAAMALHDVDGVEEQFRWDGPELGQIARTMIDNTPFTSDETVSQYAADYYGLPSSGQHIIEFSGAPLVSLLGATGHSGDSFWYAQRANDSNPRLTRAIDLRDVDAAELQYQVYIDIEHGYDFAYAAASTDGGATWQALQGAAMQGDDPLDDPSGAALASSFYTGRAGRWQQETIDLTPLGGQEILLRFEYVTDPILTFGGFAIDDIAIPQIGFFDDAEALDPGWTAEGFTRATAELPQNWWLQLITFDGDGRPTVERLQVPADGRLSHAYQAIPGTHRPILIIAATAPETLTKADYRLSIRDE